MTGWLWFPVTVVPFALAVWGAWWLVREWRRDGAAAAGAYYRGFADGAREQRRWPSWVHVEGRYDPELEEVGR